MRWFYSMLAVVLAVMTAIFALQNLEVVTLSFLNLQTRAPLAVLILVVYVAGALTGGSLYWLLRHLWIGSRRSDLDAV